jgi:hypothetical protein
MATQNQIRANRANALRSTGPKTVEGKRISAKNSTRHGMVADAVVLDGESEERFKELLADLTVQLKPRTAAESAILETMAIARWKQMRIWGVQKAGFNLEMAELKSNCNVPAARGYMVFKKLADTSNVLPLLHRYETGYDRQFCRAYAFYLKLREKPESRLEDTDFSQMSFSFATDTWEPAPEQNPDDPVPEEPPTPGQDVSESTSGQKELSLAAKTAPNTPLTPCETTQTAAVTPAHHVLRNGPNFSPQQPQTRPHPQPKSQPNRNPNRSPNHKPS